LFLPLFNNFVFESSSSSKEFGIVEEATTTIGVICKMLPWKQYYSTLKRFLGQLERRDAESAVIKAICAIVDNFHFDISSRTNATPDQMEEGQENDAMEIDTDSNNEVGGLDCLLLYLLYLYL
jgi:hypothetical protein